MLDDINNAVIDGDEYHGVYKTYKIRYINGVIKGNESLIKSFDRWEDLTDKSSNTEIIDARGSFVFELLKRSNDITEDDARILATSNGTKEMAQIWWQKPIVG